MPDDESSDDEISWLAVTPGLPVVAKGGEVIGHVTHILGDSSEDVFDGVGYRAGMHPARMLPEEAIEVITRSAIRLKLTAEEAAAQAAPYGEEAIYHAELSKRKHPFWRRQG